MCLSTLKLLLDVPWIRQILGKSLSEAALSLHLAPNSMEHPSPAVSVPAQHPSLLQHPHPALTGPQGSKATPAASLCSCCCPPAWLQDSARGIWECHSTHSHPAHSQPCHLPALEIPSRSPGKLRLFFHPLTSPHPDRGTGLEGKDEDKGVADLGRDHLHQGLPKDAPKPTQPALST